MIRKKNKLRLVILFIIIAPILIWYFHIRDPHIHCNRSFDPETWDTCGNINFMVDTFEIRILPYDSIPYISQYRNPSWYLYFDADSIPLHQMSGNKIYHPVILAEYGLKLTTTLHYSHDSIYIEKLKSLSGKIMGLSLDFDSVFFLPYCYDFPLHDCEEETMFAPWYSGMAQGQLLSVFTRAWEETKDSAYLILAEKAFNSLHTNKARGDYPWVCCVDKNNFLWIEEYPRELPCFTLNGMIFAMFGLYDYYRVTGNIDAKKLLMASLTTIKENIALYRCENELSYYCKKHHDHHGRNRYYHIVHTEQLMMLYNITGDYYFFEMSENFRKDLETLDSLEK